MPPLESMWPRNRALAFSRLATYSWESLRLKIRLHGNMKAAYRCFNAQSYEQTMHKIGPEWAAGVTITSIPESQIGSLRALSCSVYKS